MKKLILTTIMLLFSVVVWGYEQREVPYGDSIEPIYMPAYYYDVNNDPQPLLYPNSYCRRSGYDYQHREGRGADNAITTGFTNQVQIKPEPHLWVELSDTLILTYLADYPLSGRDYGTVTYLSGGNHVDRTGMWLAVYSTNEDTAGNPLKATVRFSSVENLKSTTPPESIPRPSPPLPTYYALMTEPGVPPERDELIPAEDFDGKEYKVDAFKNWRRWIWQAVDVRVDQRGEVFDDQVIITVMNDPL